jgi:D-3-phosphoglycerate dehydrogenase
MKNNWIITDHVHPLAKTRLEALGKQVDWLADIEQDELLRIIDRYEGMIISTKTAVNKELIARAGRLKIVARVGSGMEHVDKELCAARGITCLSSPEGNCNAVAEHAFGMLLSLANSLRKANNELLEGVWAREANRGFELKGRRVGIIGYGHTGSAFARKFSGWDVQVYAYDKFKEGFGDDHVHECTYDELIRQCDIISFHVPYTPETHHFIDHSFLESCKQGVILINTSRGAIADTPALIDGLETGRIAGLCLDVFEDEPLQAGRVHPIEMYRKLLSFDQVVATPHIAGWSRESKELLIQILLQKIEAELKKQSTL